MQFNQNVSLLKDLLKEGFERASGGLHVSAAMFGFVSAAVLFVLAAQFRKASEKFAAVFAASLILAILSRALLGLDRFIPNENEGKYPRARSARMGQKRRRSRGRPDVLAERRGDAEMAKLAARQIEAAFTTSRDGGDAASAAMFEAKLPKARALAKNSPSADGTVSRASSSSFIVILRCRQVPPRRHCMRAFAPL